jgi:FkbM family methyltransferase
LIETIDGVTEFSTSLRRTRNSDLPGPVRAEIEHALVYLASRSLEDLPNPVPLLGFQVSFFRAAQLLYLFQEIFIDGCYRFQTDNESPLIVDAGSNIGLSILFFKKFYPQARILGFEPDPTTYEKLRTNVGQNGLPNVDLHQCALSDKDGSTEFYHNEIEAGSLLMSVFRERMGGRKIVVPARKLSPFITEDVDLLKLDIEGSEEIVLRELSASGKLRMIKQMHIEYHHHIDRSADTLSSMLKLLEVEKFGYQLAAQPEYGRSPAPATFQDIGIYCYRKSDALDANSSL